MNQLHFSTAIKILDGKQPLNLKVWAKSSGDIIEYNNVICTSVSRRHGNANIKILASGEIRKFSLCCLFELNDMEVIL